MKNSQEAVAGSVCAQVREVSGQNMSSLWGGEKELHQGGNIAGRGRDYGHVSKKKPADVMIYSVRIQLDKYN